MENLFFCLRCSEISISDASLRCSHCEDDESGTAVSENFNLPLPEHENASPVCHMPATNAGNQKSEGFLPSVESTQEVNNQMFEEVFNIPSENSRGHGYENRSKSDVPSQNIISHDFDQYTSANQNHLEANSNTNQGRFHDQSSDIFNDATSTEGLFDTPDVSQQTNLYEQSSIVECENKHNSDELLRRQGTKEATERRIKSDRFVFTESINLESECPAVNLLSDSSEKVEDRCDKDNVPPPFSFRPGGNPSVNKCFQENLVTANGMAQQKPQTSGKWSSRYCENCGRYFKKEWTFIAHRKDFCNPYKPYKCKECREIFPNITQLLSHQMLHTGEKPFKCNQCDYVCARPDYLKTHMKTHTKK